MSSGWIPDYNPEVCDGHRCPCDCEHCSYQDMARAANRKESGEEGEEDAG